MEKIVTSNVKLLIIVEGDVILNLMGIVTLNELVSKQVKNTNNNIYILLEMKKRRSNIMTMARIQPFCRANLINIGLFNGIRVFPRLVTDRNNALFLHNISFCLMSKSKLRVLIKLLKK